MTRSRLLAYAQLLRLPNVFTAFADIALAGCATGLIVEQPGVFLLLCLSSGCLYLSGMVWNDWFDFAEDAKARPFRPLPSGRVATRTAVLIGVALLLAGLGFAALAGLPGAEVVGVKVYADGSLGGATCAVSSTYRQGAVTAEAEWNTPLTELAELIGEFHRRWLSVAVHVNGDEAVEAVVGIFATLLAQDPWPDHAHRLEHASFVPRRLAMTLSRLGLTVVTFTGYLRRLGGRLTDLYGAAALSDVAPIAALLQGGVRVMGSSDFPCGPLEPIEGIDFLVRRIGVDGTPVNPAEGIELQDAVRLFSWSWSPSGP